MTFHKDPNFPLKKENKKIHYLKVLHAFLNSNHVYYVGIFLTLRFLIAFSNTGILKKNYSNKVCCY